MSSFIDLNEKLDGRRRKRHAVLTCAGTWGQPGTQYPSNTVDGLNEFVDYRLAFNIPIDYPRAFGPVNGPIDAPSYQQSVAAGEKMIEDWLNANHGHTFVLAGYSQGGEVVSNILRRLMYGDLQRHYPQLVGGYTFGNPCRGEGMHARTIADPGGRGIARNVLTDLPPDDIWADYVHSKANGDPGDDLYSVVPLGVVGDDMTYAYDLATNIQLRDPLEFFGHIVGSLNQAADLLFGAPTKEQRKHNNKLNDLLANSLKVLFGNFSAVGGIAENLNVLWNPVDVEKKTGPDAAFDAAMRGMAFLAAPGGPTAPHISYLGEIPGYSNLVEKAVWHLHDICSRVTPRDGSE